jgi:tripartite-type tricarboxylate transporter receptor subunit TctC
MMRRIAGLGLLLAALLGVMERPAQASEWPTRTIRLIAPFPAGGSTDRIARMLASHLSDKLGVSVVVENRPGGGSTIGGTQVARSPADGYTLLLSGLATHVIAPVMSPTTAPHPIDDFTNIAFIGGAPTCLVVAASSKIASIADIVAESKAGRHFTFATVGVGSLGHLIGEQVNVDAGTRMTHVPYTTLNLTDVLEGRVEFMLAAWTTVMGLVEGGKLRLLATSTDKRMPAIPNAATFKEQGIDAAVNAWLSLSGPKGLPQPIVSRLNTLVVEFLSTPGIRQKVANDIFDDQLMSAAEFDSYLASEIARWTPRIQKALGK